MPPFLLAQSVRQAGTAKAPPAPSSSDIWGVWELAPGSGHSFAMKEPPPMQPWAADYFKAVRKGMEHDPKDTATRINEEGRDDMDPNIQCFPPGPTRIFTGNNHPFEIFQVPGRVLIHFERGSLVRQIFLDGREHPKDRAPNWLGHSTGRWEAGTLVVDTVGLNDLTWIDAAGHPHTEALHIVERFRRIDADTLENELTFDDPKAYTKTWTVTQRFKFHPDEEIMEDVVCEDHLMKEHLPKLIRGPKR